MKRVVITGATGFVGSNLTRRLLKEGHEVYLLVRQIYTPWYSKQSALTYIYMGRILQTKKPFLVMLLNIRPDWIFHLAAHGAYSWQTGLFTRWYKRISSARSNLLGACLKTGFEAFVNTGSSSEYGFKDHRSA